MIPMVMENPIDIQIKFIVVFRHCQYNTGVRFLKQAHFQISILTKLLIFSVNYPLYDLDTRRPIHNRKRGRPVGAKNTKTTQFNIESWLKDKDLSYEIIHGNFHVQGEFGPWIIYNNFSNDLSTALFQIARMYDTSINKYSLLTKKELVLKRWKKISEEFKKDLNLSLLYVEDDTITEY